MLFIRGYYYLFAAFIFTIAGICQAITFLNNLRFQLPRRPRMESRHLLSLLRLDLGKF